MLEAFVSKGAIVQPNWGMTEIGPITINIEFDNLDKINHFKQKDYTILGDMFYCDWRIIGKELWVKGETSIYDDWFATGDLVEKLGSALYYKGRYVT